ncbi:MAG: FkbM family methyltransferase [Crocinitomicaceae bacterium]|nr:FkbM family methyltransferase [Crocinitomicaceae bacterium]
MKNLIKTILQTLLGYETYLFVFAKYKIRNLKTDKKEKDFFAFLDAVKGEGDLLDVGANIGIMTYHMSKRFPRKTTMAIEPMPSNIEVLMKIIQKYDLSNVEMIPMAVGDQEDQEIKMILPKKGKVKMQGLAHVKHESITEWNEGEEYTVMSDTLDQLCIGRKIAGIKMDIENYEFFALKGAQELLLRDKPVVYLELWKNENRDNCFDFLLNLGYKAYVTTEKGLVLYTENITDKQNFIFIHHD